MATLINNAGVQHYANKMVLAENRKVGSKSLPTALADIDNLIDEMKTQFDAEYGSALDMKLENNENVFSVGTGTNIDKRSEVENSFTDVELNGNSLVNLLDYRKTTTQNLKNNQDGTYTLSAISWDYNIKASNHNVIKPNTIYSLIIDVTNWTYSGRIQFRNSLSTALIPIIANTFDINKEGRFLILCRSAEQLDYSNSFVVFKGDTPATTTGGFTIRPMLLEGDWTNKPLPQYFEGMKSVGQDDVNGHKIEILSQNKNLVSGLEVGGLYQGSGLENPSNGTFTIRNKGYIKVEPNTTYTLSIEDNNTFEGMVFHTYDINKKQIGYNESSKFTLTTPNNAYYLRFRSFNADATNVNTNLKIQLEKGNIRTSYVPYSINKKEISLNEPLRGLPNGVRDTIEKVNGEWKIVRRCGEIIFDGSETWGRSANSDLKELTSHFSATNFKSSSSTIICDKYKCVDIPLVDCEEEAVKVSGEFWVNINKSRLSTDTVAGFKEWLSQNNIRVIYKLETPIIEDISPITLQCWKNGTIFIDEVLPVETTHTVALNKPAQIKKNIEELTKLRDRVEALEIQYDQISLEQAHQLSLINHSIELDYDI